MMTVHPLHAGDGYTYLTRQVASGDVVRLRGEDLSEYYQAEGNPPGVWWGAGAAVLGVSGWFLRSRCGRCLVRGCILTRTF